MKAATLLDFVERCSTEPGAVTVCFSPLDVPKDAPGGTDEFGKFSEYVASQTKQTLWFRLQQPVIDSLPSKENALWLVNVTATSGDGNAPLATFAGAMQLTWSAKYLVQGNSAARKYTGDCMSFTFSPELRPDQAAAVKGKTFATSLMKARTAENIRESTKPKNERVASRSDGDARMGSLSAPRTNRRVNPPSSGARAPAR